MSEVEQKSDKILEIQNVLNHLEGKMKSWVSYVGVSIKSMDKADKWITEEFNQVHQFIIQVQEARKVIVSKSDEVGKKRITAPIDIQDILRGQSQGLEFALNKLNKALGEEK